jgi:hypothetical protein
MRGFVLALIVAGFGMGQAAGAESAVEAIAAFGLLGSWSIDCSTPTQTCEPNVGCGAFARKRSSDAVTYSRSSTMA